jgi:hypothetical protein
MNRGTPKTLKEAIQNGMVEAVKRGRWNAAQQEKFNRLDLEAQQLTAQEVHDEQIRVIENHVLDFFRQKFGVAYLDIEQWAEDRTYKDPAQIVRELAENTGVTKRAA